MVSTSSTLTHINHPYASSPPTTTKPSSSYTLSRRPWRLYVTPFDTILNHRYEGSGTDESPFIVDWLSNDPEDPQKWASAYKWTTIGIVAVATLAVTLASSAYSGGLTSLHADFGSSTELMTAGVSLFVLGFGAGPLIWAPASEIFGRRVIYNISFAFLTLWCAVGAASQNITQVLVFRFLAGFFGSSPLANAGGTIADVTNAHSRGLAMACYAAAPFLGPALGPISGGFIGMAGGWRWIQGFLGIITGVLTLVLILFSAETYAPTLLRRRAATLSKATGLVYRFRADARAPLDIKKLMTVSLVRPWKFLFLEPIVLFLSIWIAIIYGCLYLSFSAYPIVFQQSKGWNAGVGGLAFLGVLVGVMLAVLATIVYINPQYIKTSIRKGGQADPEDRLGPAIVGGISVVIGLAGFAATCGPNTHWIAPIIFGAPFGFGMVTTFLAVLAYLVDVYSLYAASALAANAMLRALFGAAFPLFTRYMYQNLGLQWGSSIPAFLSFACLPFAFIFWKYGNAIRARSPLAVDAERQLQAIIAARMASAKFQDDEEKRVQSGMNTPARRESDGRADERTLPGDTVIGADTAGGAGKLQDGAAKAIDETPRRYLPEHAENEHEWTRYEALADRDEVDLGDEERLHLKSLREKFDRAREQLEKQEK